MHWRSSQLLFKRWLTVGLLLPLTALLANTAVAEQVFASVENYVARAFATRTGAEVTAVANVAAPTQQTLWVTPELRERLQRVLGHAVGLRLKYWRQGGRTVWILNEIGKDRPITTGVTVDNNQLQDIEVLIYRESRGWEVKHEFFTDQFLGARLTAAAGLDRRIDSITGATLSVRAMQRMARAALLLHGQTDANTTTTAQAPVSTSD